MHQRSGETAEVDFGDMHLRALRVDILLVELGFAFIEDVAFLERLSDRVVFIASPSPPNRKPTSAWIISRIRAGPSEPWHRILGLAPRRYGADAHFHHVSSLP